MVYKYILERINAKYGSFSAYEKESKISKKILENLLCDRPIGYKSLLSIRDELGMRHKFLCYDRLFELANARYGNINNMLGELDIQNKKLLLEHLMEGQILQKRHCEQICKVLNIQMYDYFPTVWPNQKNRFEKNQKKYKYEYKKLLDIISDRGQTVIEFLNETRIPKDKVLSVAQALTNCQPICNTFGLAICDKLGMDFDKVFPYRGNLEKMVETSKISLSREQVSQLFDMDSKQFEKLSVDVLEVFGVSKSMINKFNSPIYGTDIKTIGDYARKARRELYPKTKAVWSTAVVDKRTASLALAVLAYYGIYVQPKKGTNYKYEIRDRKPYFSGNPRNVDILDFDYLFGLLLIKSRNVTKSTHEDLLKPFEETQEQSADVSSYARFFANTQKTIASSAKKETAENEAQKTEGEAAEEKFAFEPSEKPDGESAMASKKPHDKRYYSVNGWVTGTRVRKHNMMVSPSLDEFASQMNF